MNTRITTAALIAAGLLALTGCSSSDSPSTVKAKPKPTVSKDDQFLAAVDKASITSWASTGPDDADLLDFPQRWCDSLAEGHSADHILTADQGLLYPAGDDWGTQRKDANELLVLAAKVYCPASLDQLTADLRATGEY